VTEGGIKASGEGIHPCFKNFAQMFQRCCIGIGWYKQWFTPSSDTFAKR
jgi:hypothetical protein